MNNQFVGDIGDYTKLGILRKLEKAGLTLGINWYLTPDDSKKTGGSHIQYLCDSTAGRKEKEKPDSELHQLLKDIRINNMFPQKVDSLMRAFNESSTVDYREPMGFTNSNEGIRQQRLYWHNAALKKLCSKDVVFLDPDNALQATKDPYESTKGNLFVAYQEVYDYYCNGSSVIVYNHLPIRSNKDYFLRNRLLPITDMYDTFKNNVDGFEASRRSVRFYFIFTQPKHKELIRKLIFDMIDFDGWENYLVYLGFRLKEFPVYPILKHDKI